MNNSKITDFWQNYTNKMRISGCLIPEKYTVWHFCNDQPGADELARLVLAGKKTATAGLLWSYESEGSAVPQPGDLSIITLWNEEPVCIIETTSTHVIPFNEVPASFAYDEGEGDRSLAYWKKVHQIFFSEECISIGKTPEPDMPVVCENFQVVYRSGE
jgi:uncharacterized protein YhfF